MVNSLNCYGKPEPDGVMGRIYHGLKALSLVCDGWHQMDTSHVPMFLHKRDGKVY